ncbi:MAG: preprotein translocase subunit YajC [Omnitrophica bacterium RIFCSPHIGHO2_02_FULL_51_18]|nr:MAG: preprotein translocase subunit YajC [Omnitrophica bacterium RIFCSPHIGHO2_02_FULL_51_18]
MPDQPNVLIQFLPLVFLFVIFYFLIIRPQQKKQKEHANLIAKLDKNDEVITVGGVHATVISVGDKTAVLRIADNVKIEIEKSSISQVKKSRQA